MKLLIIFGWIAILILLTILTQIGGIILLLSLLIYRFTFRRFSGRLNPFILQTVLFILLYLSASFLLLPPVANTLGRKALPLFSHPSLKPLHIITCILNRHYVSHGLYLTALKVSENMADKYPGTITAYLDGNFPFVNGFPLLPHLSHDDGHKLDLAFYYTDSNTGEPFQRTAPSWIGYGGYETPQRGEMDTPGDCIQRGYWQYGLLKYLSVAEKQMDLDINRTRDMIRFFAREPQVGKIFLEPYLQQRMNLNHPKIRFHGCHAVRHDDHLHVQVK